MSHAEELLKRLSAAPQNAGAHEIVGPLAPALDLLRRVHHLTDGAGRREGVRAAGGDAAALARLVEAALRGDEDEEAQAAWGSGDAARELGGARSRGLSDPDAADEHGAAASARDVLTARERRLRREENLTARILDQMEHGDAVSGLQRSAPLQEELRIRCPAGGTSGGRFVVRNDLGEPARILFRDHALHAVPGSVAERACLTVEPGAVDLAPGEERLVRIGIDLRRAPLLATTAEFVVDACAGGEVLQKLWVSLDVAAPEPGSGETER
jgi:hypothetical protein